MRTHEIAAAMRVRYPAPEWALFFEVANATGSNGKTRADAVAMNLYPSRGLEVYGFEFKAHRSDWKKELSSPKAEPVAKYCDKWFVVAAEGVILDVNEVPAGWGYIKAMNGQLRTIKEAPHRESTPIDRHFLASILRRSSENDQAVMDEFLRREREKIRKNVEDEYRQRRESENRNRSSLQESVNKFQQISGIEINAYNGERLGELVKLAELLGHDRMWAVAREMLRSAERFSKEMDDLLKKLDDNKKQRGSN